MTPIPLVMLHHAGGSASVFEALVKSLPAEIDPVPLELPGRGRRWREKLVTTVDDAVEDLIGQIEGLPRRFAVLGHSMGSYLGLALAARLEEEQGMRCTTLFASANAGPLGAVLPFEGSPLLTSDEEIFTIAERTGGTISTQIREHSMLRARTADLLRADFSLGDTFLRNQRRTVTEANIVVTCGTEDVFTEDQLHQWKFSTTAHCDVIRFPGDHFYLQPESAGLATLIAERLTGAATGPRATASAPAPAAERVPS